MMRRPGWLLLASLAGSLPVTMVDAQNLTAIQKELTDIDGEATKMVNLELQGARLRSPTHVEERLTDGELFYRLHDYMRAAIIFTDIVENYPSHAACPDASFLLADSLFNARDYLGARTQFRKILERADNPSYQPYVQQSLGRLIEIAIHLQDFQGVDTYFQRLDGISTVKVDPAIGYLKAKYLYSIAVPYSVGRGEGPITESFNADELERARLAFDAIPEGNPYFGQSQYFVGAIYTLRGEYPLASKAFRRALMIKPETDEQKDIAEITQLALGRVYYEMDMIAEANAAFQTIPSTSARFDVALYENAWAYIRMGDSFRAEQALEVLTIAVPESPHIPDAKLLRGNLLLRDGRFNDADEVFADVSKQFQKVRDDLDKNLTLRADPTLFFRELVRDNLTAFDASTFLPPSAQRWVEPSYEMERALGTLSDLAQTKALVKETGSIVDRLTRALRASNRVNVFLDLRAQRERTTALRNRLAQTYRALIAAEEEDHDDIKSSELTALRAKRRSLEKQLMELPKSSGAIEGRNAKTSNKFRRVAKEISRLETELLGMEAKLVATERFLNDTARLSGEPEAAAAVREELARQKEALAGYSESLRVLTLDLEAGRLQVGVGDEDFTQDDEVRKQYEALVSQERQLVAKLGGKPSPVFDLSFQRITTILAKLDSHDARIDELVQQRVAQMEKVLAEESVNLDGYRSQLANLEGSAEDVIGAVAQRHYLAVQQRFYDLVMRSDLGSIDVAWARREEHRMRVENLSKSRNSVLRALDAEFSEIMDQGEAP